MKKTIILLLCLLIPSDVICFSQAGEDKVLVVIINKDNSIDNLDSHELVKIYKGEQQNWPGGQKIVVLNYPYNAVVRSQFYAIVLDAKPTQKYFLKGSPILFTPMILESESAVLKFIARIPDAIAYVYLDKVDDTVKVVKIDGVAPTEDGYKLGNTSAGKDK